MMEESNGKANEIKDTETSQETLKFFGKDTYKNDLISGAGGILFGLLLQISATITGPLSNIVGLIILALAVLRLVKAKSNSQKRLLKPLLEKDYDKLILYIPGITQKEILIKQIKEIEIKKFLAGTRIKLTIEGSNSPVMFLNTIFDKDQREEILALFESLKNKV
jgi:hypothetical protein